MKFQSVQRILKNDALITIREAVKKDAGNLLETKSKCIIEGEFLISSIEEFNPTIQDEARWIQTLNESRNSILLVAIYKNEVIGSVDLKGEVRKKIRHNAILGISILKKWQNLGLGKILMQYALGWAKNNLSLEFIWLHVFANHTIAIKLYKELGFEEAFIQKHFIKINNTYIDNVIMKMNV